MKTQKYRAYIKDNRTGATFPVIVEAETGAQAKQMVVGQYGSSQVVHPPMPI